MLAIISPLIQRGVIDNTLKDLIDLRLWCVDGAEPIHYRLRGNCLRDIAGCRVEFTNASAGSSEPQEREQRILQLLRESTGDAIAGDITLSHRQREQNNRGLLSNCLMLELFLGTKIRVLIESSNFTFSISLPQWHMTWAQENAQRFFNMEAMRNHVAYNVEHYQGPSLTSASPTFPLCDWDYRLNRAEACMAIFPSVRDKYAGVVGGELNAAYVMDRISFLNDAADEEEAHLLPDPDAQHGNFEVMDFVPPAHVPALRRAMQHPLFREASAMTNTVQQRLLANVRKLSNTARSQAEQYLTAYAGIVSHILGTILLAQESSSNTEIASTRIRNLEMRVADLNQFCKELPADSQEALYQAGRSLIAGLGDLLASIHKQ